ncbi:Methyltransferase FkbM domain-containing protein [Hyunsoonleella jejuensis]|uniref:Methyltransferase FkbM domain-containing protein n=1 Tax=Hyunsoonleella jejuensis TaxID=419940 RepID=A0A1H9D877_9FLAO|nr:FkbM family methyltransferase [Hyunsoonleella jejuensis]SEQ09676.1 Methyltransferase FkbM domain-containing protein [Hyunsoonleella jejuensis]
MDNYYNKIKEEFLVEEPSLFRFGSIGDGGYYLKPETIKSSGILISGGISSNLEFEYDIFRFNKTIDIVMIDPTVSGFKLIFKGLARIFFKKPDKIRYLFNALIFNYLVQQKRCNHLKLWLKKPVSLLKFIETKVSTDSKILLKLDIEGGEYDFLDEISTNLDEFSAMVFEFHDMHLHHQKVHSFIKECHAQFSLVFMGENPSGGYNDKGEPKCIEITLERK